MINKQDKLRYNEAIGIAMDNIDRITYAIENLDYDFGTIVKIEMELYPESESYLDTCELYQKIARKAKGIEKVRKELEKKELDYD